MSFFKIEKNNNTSPSAKRLEIITWLLIYAGLLVLLLGIFVLRSDETLGWLTLGMGAVGAATGFVLIYMRSRIPQ